MHDRVWDADAVHAWQMLFLHVFAYTYAFAFGASLASFLNVVVYRLPRGLNLVRPGSRCPKCATPIEARDNIPVLGWLALRGRCRICGASIAPRYLLIEIAIGLLFVLLLHLEVFRGGVNLPGRASQARHGLTILYSSETWELGRLALYHALLLSLLLVVALIEYDRQRVPRRLWSVIVAIGLVAPLVWADLRPVHYWPVQSASESASGGVMAAVLDGMAGVAGGILFGMALALAVRRGERRGSSRDNIVAAMLAIGAYLGWQAVANIAVLTGFALTMGSLADGALIPLRRLTPLCYVMGAAWLYVPCWKWLDALAGRTFGQSIVLGIAAMMGVVLLLAVACRWLHATERKRRTDRLSTAL